MRLGLVLIFLALPLLELAILIKVGQWMGFWWTMLVLVATAVGGGLLVHAQGFAALRRMNEAVERGRPPIEPVIDSVFLLVAGALMLTPGLITDVVGGVLLIPPVRRAIARYLLHRLLTGGVVTGRTRTHGPTGAPDEPHGGLAGSSESGGQPDHGIVIDGEWEEVEDPSVRKRPGAGPSPPRSGGQTR